MLNDCGAWSYNGMWTIVYYASFNLITGLDVLQDGDTRSCINLDSLAANPLHFLPPFFTKWKKHSRQNSRCCLPSMSLERRVVEQGVYYYFLVKFACLLDCFCLFVFSICIFPIPSFGCGLKDLFLAAHKVSKLSISITFWWCHKWKGRGNAWALLAVELWIR